MVYPARSKAVRDAASQVEPGTHDQRQLHSAPGHRTQGEADQDHRASGQAARDTTFRAVRDTPGCPELLVGTCHGYCNNTVANIGLFMSAASVRLSL